ncbi:serine acetyltransferase [bacterium]|nr:MAG: serine acetyltransferase [bacterium]
MSARLSAARQSHVYPPGFRRWAERFADSSLGLLFPHYAGQCVRSPEGVSIEIDRLSALLREGLVALPTPQGVAGKLRHLDEVAKEFIAGLEEIYEALQEDAEALYQNDPAADSVDEILFAYPGFYATAVYRLAHRLVQLEVPLLPRMLSEVAHSRVGVDIHPGAIIGRSFFIDHGTGIVVGGTSVIGEGVKLYQGVTLGAHQVHKRLAGVKRHPTIEDDVVVYAHATILGDIVVGKGSIIGGNTWITAGVPPHSVVTNRTTVRPSVEVPDFSI